MECVGPAPDTWEKLWINRADHLLVKLRVVHHQDGAWVILLSCPFGHGAVEEHWSGANFGTAKTVGHLESIYRWLESSIVPS